MDHKGVGIKNSKFLSYIIILPLILFSINVESLRELETIIKMENNTHGVSEISHTIEGNIFALSSNSQRERHIKFYKNPECKYEPRNIIIINNIFYKPPHSTAISISKGYSTVIKNNITISDNLIPLYFKDTDNNNVG